MPVVYASGATNACVAMQDVSMEVILTDDPKAFVRQGIESGQYSREEDALAMWEKRERRRMEILASRDLSEASFA